MCTAKAPIWEHVLLSNDIRKTNLTLNLLYKFGLQIDPEAKEFSLIEKSEDQNQ